MAIAWDYKKVAMEPKCKRMLVDMGPLLLQVLELAPLEQGDASGLADPGD